MPNVKTQPSPLKYQRIRAELVSTIRSGTYQTGDKLPSENDLAGSFGASRSTVIRALRDVEEQGLIERRQGSGSFVTRKALQPSGNRAAVGLLKTVQSSRFTDSIVDQLQARLSVLLQRRDSALIVHTIEKTDHPTAIARSILNQRVAGIFFVPMPPMFSEQSNEQLIDVIRRSGQPIVLLDSDIAPPPQRSEFDLVGVDNRRCGYMQTAHLLKMGLKRILFLGIKPQPSTVAERLLGYREAMHDHGIDAPPQWVCLSSADDVEASFVSEIIAHRPEGIVCKSDEFAALLIHKLAALGVAVPRDLKVVGFDDRPIASLLPATLTTIRQPVAEIAESALQLMDNRIAHPERAASYVQITGTLIVRQSTSS
jgi:GntR family transcriptional regulator, arabinose operon transcriptional repressor